MICLLDFLTNELTQTVEAYLHLECDSSKIHGMKAHLSKDFLTKSFDIYFFVAIVDLIDYYRIYKNAFHIP